MENKKTPTVLLLGNGINRAFNGISWSGLMKKINTNTDIPRGYELTSPMPLQAIILTNNNVSYAMKKYKNEFYGKVEQIRHREMLQKILRMGFDYIITTNYSYELETVAIGKEFISDRELKIMQKHTDAKNVKRSEAKYMLHTYNEVNFEGVENKIWHIHGEARKPGSIVLGHYYYGSLLHRYESFFDKRKNSYFEAEASGEKLDIVSWLDAFILGNIYILGFNYELSEFDLWWLLNRKYNENANVGKIYFYEMKENVEFNEKLALMKVFNVLPYDLGFEKEDNLYEEFYNAALQDIENKMLFDKDY